MEGRGLEIDAKNGPKTERAHKPTLGPPWGGFGAAGWVGGTEKLDLNSF